MKFIFMFLIAVVVGLKGYDMYTANNSTPTSTTSSYTTQRTSPAQVTLYATAWCGYCKKARRLLKDNNIDYVEYDIEKSSTGRKAYEKLGGGGVPLLVIDDTVVRGYDKRQILALTR